VKCVWMHWLCVASTDQLFSGAEASRTMFINDRNEAEPFTAQFLQYLTTLSVTMWVFNLIDG
jgi:hypothetical protein